MAVTIIVLSAAIIQKPIASLQDVRLELADNLWGPDGSEFVFKHFHSPAPLMPKEDDY